MIDYQANDRVIWMSEDRREGSVKRYQKGTIKAAYKSGLLINWDNGVLDLISYEKLGFMGMYLPLLKDFEESQESLGEFQENVKPLLFGCFYPLQPSKDFETLPLIKNIDRHSKNRKDK